VSAHAGKIQVKKHDVRTWDFAGIDGIDIPNHGLAVRHCCETDCDVVLTKRFSHKEDVSRVVLSENYLNDGIRLLT